MHTFRRGFTLIEIIVVIAIIGLLTSVAFFSFSVAREKSRDARRMADIDQLELGLRLYVEQYGSDIDCDGGLKFDGQTAYTEADTIDGVGGIGCPDGTQIISFIISSYGSVPVDPNGPNNSDYFYYFSDEHACSPTKSILFAVNLESKVSNASTVCAQNGNSNNEGGYSFTSAAFVGGTLSPSVPHVKEIKFSR